MFKKVNVFGLLTYVMVCQFAGVIGSIFTASSFSDCSWALIYYGLCYSSD